ncbi:MAG: NnrU family protein [Proteobacteria bacterium]|nr:NnrU family protein [Pseudomonadota bacterium]
MALLLFGLVMFLGTHTLATFRQQRATLIGRMGLNGYRGLFSALSAVGLLLIVLGFERYRLDGLIPIWSPPAGMRHVTMLLVWIAFVSLAAAYSPAGKIKGLLRHPMLVGIKAWALGHLLANGDLGGIVLFGAFLLWAGYDRIAIRRRGDKGAPRSAITAGDGVAIAAGTVAYVAMIWAHPYLIGVSVL